MATQAPLLYGWYDGVISVHAWEISLDDYGLFSRVRHPRSGPQLFRALLTYINLSGNYLSTATVCYMHGLCQSSTLSLLPSP